MLGEFLLLGVLMFGMLWFFVTYTKYYIYYAYGMIVYKYREYHRDVPVLRQPKYNREHWFEKHRRINESFLKRERFYRWIASPGNRFFVCRYFFLKTFMFFDLPILIFWMLLKINEIVTMSWFILFSVLGIYLFLRILIGLWMYWNYNDILGSGKRRKIRAIIRENAITERSDMNYRYTESQRDNFGF